MLARLARLARSISPLLFVSVSALPACTTQSAPPVSSSAPAVIVEPPASQAATKPAAALPPGQTKAPLRGLIDMQDIAWHDQAGGEPSFTIDDVTAFPGSFGGVVVNATWDTLQPSREGGLQVASIDAALGKVRAYNAANPSAQIGVKLRVYGGSNAPSWAKSIDGGPVSIARNAQGCHPGPCPLTIGKVWSPAYIAAWRSFQALLAARYDPEPLVRQVAVTSCATQTDEPFVPSVDPPSRASLRAAGYTDAAGQACLEGAIDDYADWKTTLVDYTFNAFVKIGGGVDAPFTTSVMNRCRSALGARCVLDNHALSSPTRPADAEVYRTMRALGGPINFQTEAPRGMGCKWTATIAQGVDIGAVAIEVWPEARFQGFVALTKENVTTLANEFTRPIAVPPASPSGADCTGFH